MENIAKLDKSCIFNTYDIKGSTHARKVIKETDRIYLVSNFSVGKTLKDEDFKAKEKAMVVSTSVKRALLEQIEKDANFFSSIGVIDYSMILFKVDRSNDVQNKEMLSRYGYAPDQTLKQFESFQSDREDKRYYWHAGIIDYFQKFTLTKAAERVFKKGLDW